MAIALVLTSDGAIAQSDDEIVNPAESGIGGAAVITPRPRRLGDSLNVDNTQEWRAGNAKPSRANSGLSLLDEQLQQARKALSSGRIMAPQRGALDIFRKVLALDPGNALATQGIADTANALAARMRSVYASGDQEGTRIELGHLRVVAPTHPAIEEMSELLLQDHQAGLLADAAKQAETRQHWVGADSAADLYVQLLALSPESQVAAEGLQRIESQMIAQAQRLTDQQRFNSATQLLTQAAGVRDDPENAVVTQQVSTDGARRAFVNGQLEDASELIVAGRFDQAETLLAQVSDQATGEEFARSINGLGSNIAQGRLTLAYVPGTRLENSLNMASPAMIVVPKGGLEMASTSTVTNNSVQQDTTRRAEFPVPFTLSETEVTVAQYRVFVDATSYITDAEKLGESLVFDETQGATQKRRGINWRFDFRGRKAKSTLPVVHVSWNDAVAYTRWLSEQSGETYRLPTGAEFEYALRGGTQSTYWWGNQEPDAVVENLTGDRDRLNNLRWPDAFDGYGDGHWGPAPVSEFQANAFQLFDLGGNVSEWVSDCYWGQSGSGLAKSSVETIASCPRRAVRGASWATPPAQASSGYRAAASADMASCLVGFRVVKELWVGPLGGSA